MLLYHIHEVQKQQKNPFSIAQASLLISKAPTSIFAPIALLCKCWDITSLAISERIFVIFVPKGNA